MEKVAGEVININNEYKTYQDYKAAVDSEMQRSAESFVRIGYLLKLARDTDILTDTPYGSVNEFAQSEYGLDKSQVSRFIRINDEYSEGGYSDRLVEKYRGYGYAKLALMLLIPASIAEEISADYSKNEIQAVKEEIDEEKKITDIEVMLEGKDEKQAVMESMLDRVIHQLGHDQPGLYVQMLEIPPEDLSGLQELLAPSGEAIHSVRIRGTGRMLLNIKGVDTDVIVMNVRSGEKEYFGWEQMRHAVEMLAVPEASPDHKKEWEILYGELFPAAQKTEAAPVQPKPAQKKQSKVTRAKTSKDDPKYDPKTEDMQKLETEQESGSVEEQEAAGLNGHSSEAAETSEKIKNKPDAGEEQLPGQMNLETDFSEYCPKTGNRQNTEVAPVQPEKEEYKKYLGDLKDYLDEIYWYAEAGKFEDVEAYMIMTERLLTKLKQLKEDAGAADEQISEETPV